MPGEDGMFHLAFWLGEGGVVEVVVVGVRRIVELDKGLAAWAESKILWLWMGRVEVSWWSRSVLVACVHPVAIRRAAFWTVWSFLILVLDVVGDQIGAA